MSAPRVVSLLPSATEIVCALGLRDALVGRSHECDHPPGVEALPVCSRPTVDVAARSAAIDRSVRERLKAGLSVYDVSEEVLSGLAPDVIVTQSQCEACAVTPDDVERAVAEWTGARPEIVSLAPERLADVWEDVRRVADALGVPGRGREVVESLENRAARMASDAQALVGRPRVACIEWVDPLMAAGNWVPELVSLAGGEDVLGQAGEHASWLEWDALAAADPEVVVVMPCGFDIARTRRELAPLTARPGWRRLAAVGEARAFLADGHQYFNRPGPRLVESLEILAEILHPEAFRFGHRGAGWEPL